MNKLLPLIKSTVRGGLKVATGIVMKHRAHAISGNAAAALLLLLIGGCSPLDSKIQLHDLAGLSTKDRDAVTAHARSQEEFYAERFRQEAESRGVPWGKRVLSISVEGDSNRIRVFGIYTIGDIYRGGPRFEGVKTKVGWTFSPGPINPC